LGQASGSKAGRGGGKENEKKRKEEKVGWAAGRIGLVRCVFFSFLFFKSFLKTFKPFQIQFFSQISPTIFKGFSQTLLTTFQTYFKFKPSFFNSNFYTNFHKLFTIILKLFHKYFKTFKTTPQPKLMHFNMMHKHLGDSNY
jgi:hypothetical protein